MNKQNKLGGYPIYNYAMPNKTKDGVEWALHRNDNGMLTNSCSKFSMCGDNCKTNTGGSFHCISGGQNPITNPATLTRTSDYLCYEDEFDNDKKIAVIQPHKNANGSYSFICSRGPTPSPPSTICGTKCVNNGGKQWPDPTVNPNFYNYILPNNTFSIMNYGPADTCNNKKKLDGTVVYSFTDLSCTLYGELKSWYNNPQSSNCYDNLKSVNLTPSNSVVESCGEQSPIKFKYLTAVTNLTYGDINLDAIWASHADNFDRIITKFKFTPMQSNGKLYYTINTVTNDGLKMYLTWHKQKKYVNFSATTQTDNTSPLSSAWGFHNHGNNFIYIIGLDLSALPENNKYNPSSLGFYQNTKNSELSWQAYTVSEISGWIRDVAGACIGQNAKLDTFNQFAPWPTGENNEDKNLALFYCCNN